MPFEFTGKAPPPATGDSPFQPFRTAVPPQIPAARPAFGGLGTAPSFGSSFGTSSSSPFSAPASFGTSSSPWAARPSGAVSQQTGTAASQSQREFEPPANVVTSEDALSRALQRTMQGKTAFFGAVDVGGGAVLQAYMDDRKGSGSKAQLEGLVKELEGLTSRYPLTTDFMRYMFEQAAVAQGALKPGKASSSFLKPAAVKDGNADCRLSLAVRQELETTIDAKLVELRWSEGRWSSQGYYHNERAKVVLFLVSEYPSKDALLEALKEETICDTKEESRLPAFVDWLLGEVDRVCRKHEGYGADGPEDDGDSGAADTHGRFDLAATGGNGNDETGASVQEDPEADLAFFKPRADYDAKYSKMAKTGDYTSIGYLGYRNTKPAAEDRPCCNKRAEISATSFVNAHLYLSDSDAELLKSWVLKSWVLEKLPSLANAQPETVADMVISLLSSDKPEAAVKARCESELRKCLLNDTATFVDGLFDALSTKAYLPDRADSEANVLESKPPTPDEPATSREPAALEEPFRFLDLPPELRTWVYRHALIPGMVRLRVCAHHIPYSVSGSPTPGLLATCKQVNKEAKDLLFENTFIVDGVIDAGNRRMFHSTLVPKHILPQINSLVVVFNLHLQYGDWRQLRAMTGLKSLTVCGFSNVSRGHTADWREVLQRLLESVPATCEVKFGPRSQAENQHLYSMFEEVKWLRTTHDMAYADTRYLQTVAEEVGKTVIKGLKSGTGAVQVTEQGSSSRWGYM